MFNVILFADTPEAFSKTRGYGAHRLASHIREHGYTCLVVDFMSALDLENYTAIMENAVGEETLMVGFSSTWMPYRFTLLNIDTDETRIHDPGRAIVEDIDITRNSADSIFAQKLTTALTDNNPEPYFNVIKQINPKVQLTLGGSKIGMYTDMKMIDHIFVGYSETMLIDYLDSISGKSPRKIFNKMIDHDQKAQAPVWDYTVSKTTYTEFDFIKAQEPLALEVARGCRFKCKYCSYPLIGMKNISSYLKKSDVLRQELMYNYENFGTTRYFIIDDTFNDSVEKMEYFLEITRSLPFKITYWCYLRLDLLMAKPETIPMLLESGLSSCYFGIETFNHAAGKAVGKGAPPDKLKETLFECKRVWGDNVHIQAGFMVGLPFEDSASVFETAKWLEREDCPIDTKWIFPLQIAQANNDIMKYTYQSEFDKNSHMYGYEIPNPDVFWEWTKDDKTDINTLAKAEEVSLQAESNIQNKIDKGDLNLASLSHPVLSDRDVTLKMSDQEYTDLVDSIDREQLWLTDVTNDYFKPLINKLRLK